MKNNNLSNKYVDEFRALCIYIKDGLKNYLRYLSYPDKKSPIIIWIAYLSYLIVNISMIMSIVSIFFFPSGVWQFFAVIFTIFAFIFFSIVMTYEPK